MALLGRYHEEGRDFTPLLENCPHRKSTGAFTPSSDVTGAIKHTNCLKDEFSDIR